MNEPSVHQEFKALVHVIDRLASRCDGVYGAKSRVAQLARQMGQLCETMAATTDPARPQRELLPETIVTRVNAS